jgi:hypothetical protein
LPIRVFELLNLFPVFLFRPFDLASFKCWCPWLMNCLPPQRQLVRIYAILTRHFGTLVLDKALKYDLELGILGELFS